MARRLMFVRTVDDTKAMMRYLLDKGADINAPDSRGRTLLTGLKEFGFPDSHLSIQFLKKLGAKM